MSEAAAAPPKVSGAQSLREVRRGVAEAGDAQVLQVVRMVDALAERGATDEVLAPVRARLRAIQPARPLRFARLLFLPVDPLIVTPAAWRAGTPYLPRHALMVLARAVRAEMSAPDAPPAVRAALDAADRLISGATTADRDLVRRGGALVWALAGRALARVGSSAACQADWAAQGLPPGELAPMATALAAVASVALALHDAEFAGPPPPDQVFIDMLARAEARGPRAWTMMLCLLMIRAPQAGSALLVAAQAMGVSRAAAEMASETALGWIEAGTDAQPVVLTPDAAEELNRQTSLLDALSEQPGDAAMRRRLVVARGALVERSAHRYESTLQDTLLGPLQDLAAAPADRDAVLDGLEASARLLRAFELEARRLGAGQKCDAALRGLDRALVAAPGLSPMDQARLMEVLAGPEAALRLLGGG